MEIYVYLLIACVIVIGFLSLRHFISMPPPPDTHKEQLIMQSSTTDDYCC